MFLTPRMERTFFDFFEFFFYFLTLEDVPDSWDEDEDPKWIQCDLPDHTFHVGKDWG